MERFTELNCFSPGAFYYFTCICSDVPITLNFFYFFLNFIYLFLVALGLRCRTRAFSSCGERGLLFVAVRRLLIAVASLVAEHGLYAHGLQ